MLKFLNRFPWWFWVAILIGILFYWQLVSGFTYSRKLWNIVKAEILADEHRIIEELEHENLRNQQEKESLYKQILNLKAERARLQKEKDLLSGRIQELENALQNVSVPSDPDALLDLLRKHGLRSIQRRKW